MFALNIYLFACFSALCLVGCLAGSFHFACARTTPSRIHFQLSYSTVRFHTLPSISENDLLFLPHRIVVGLWWPCMPLWPASLEEAGRVQGGQVSHLRLAEMARWVRHTGSVYPTQQAWGSKASNRPQEDRALDPSFPLGIRLLFPVSLSPVSMQQLPPCLCRNSENTQKEAWDCPARFFHSAGRWAG